MPDGRDTGAGRAHDGPAVRGRRNASRTASRRARELNAAGFKVTLDYLGESVHNREEAVAAADTYLRLIDRIAAEGLDANVSLKLTQMGQDIDEAFLHENVERVLDSARCAVEMFVRFDMEGRRTRSARSTSSARSGTKATQHRRRAPVVHARTEHDVREANRSAHACGSARARTGSRRSTRSRTSGRRRQLRRMA
jgi:hypothetical protein